MPKRSGLRKRSQKKSKFSRRSRRRLSGGLLDFDPLVNIQVIVPFITAVVSPQPIAKENVASIFREYKGILNQTFSKYPTRNIMSDDQLKQLSALMTSYAVASGYSSSLRTQIRATRCFIEGIQIAPIFQGAAYTFDENNDEVFELIFVDEASNPNWNNVNGYVIIANVLLNISCRRSFANSYFISKYVTDALNEMTGLSKGKLSELLEDENIFNLTIIKAKNQFEQVQKNTKLN